MQTPQEEFEKLLGLTYQMKMPFGKHAGRYVYDLPYEYLAWFLKKGGFPKGPLGQVMEFVHDIKRDGAEQLFNPWWEERGGRPSFRKVRQKEWHFSKEE